MKKATDALWRWWLVTGVFICIAAIYIWEMSRGPGWGDSLTFIVSALEGCSWSVNATGHLLYDNLNVLFVSLIPWVEPGRLLAFVSIAFALLTLGRIFQTAVILTDNMFASLLATIGFAFSFAFWRQAEQVEVYTCASLMTASALRCMLSDTKRGTYDNIVASGIWMGLAVLVHIQTVLLLPMYFIYVLGSWRIHRMKTALSVAALVSAFLVLIVPAFLLPGYTVSSVFFDFRFRDEVTTVGIGSVLKGAFLSIAYVLYSFHIHIISMVAGCVKYIRKPDRVFVLILTGTAAVWLFAMRYPVSDQYVFFLNAYLFLALLAAHGYAMFLRRVTSQKMQIVFVAFALVFSQFVYTIPLSIAHHIPRLQMFDEQKAYKGGLDYYFLPGLRTIPDFFEFYDRQTHPGTPAYIEQELWDRLSRQTVKYRALMGDRK